MPARGAELGDDDVVVLEVVVVGPVVELGVTVSVVVLGDGGAASGVCGEVPVSRPPKISSDANTTARPNSRTVTAASTTWVRPNRGFRAWGGGGGGVGVYTGGYGV
jgi:hypothetical protein